jgi:6-phosphogluconate dehydrogenase
MAELCQFGVTGLAVMGANLARNIARHGFSVAVHNRTTERTERFYEQFGSEGAITPTRSIQEFVAAIARPRSILIMVKAGQPVDTVIAEVEPFLDAGDILIDGGNSLFADTQRRTRELEAKGFRYLGIGVSGGEEGALHGPSIMPGGTREAYAHVERILTTIAAHVDGSPCCTYIGPDGAGHYVKMVHNGIEYADMQLITEAYDLLSQVVGLSAPELAEIFSQWKAGDLDSYLIEITAEVLRKRDAATGTALVDMILDEAEQKGTGRWTVQSALDLGVPITAIGEAVFARVLSSQKSERVAASRILRGPARPTATEQGQAVITAVRDALYASKIVAYAQGFAQMSAASEAYHWTLNLGEIATIWRGGCIIRAKFLDRIKDAYDQDPRLRNLLLAPYFREGVQHAQAAWRQVVSLAVNSGVPVPAFSTSLAYFDGYRSARGPANLLQGLRDYFGAHTYRRVDRDGSFHTLWSGDGSEVPA